MCARYRVQRATCRWTVAISNVCKVHSTASNWQTDSGNIKCVQGTQYSEQLADEQWQYQMCARYTTASNWQTDTGNIKCVQGTQYSEQLADGHWQYQMCARYTTASNWQTDNGSVLSHYQ